jgi:hypothetical protein
MSDRCWRSHRRCRSASFRIILAIVRRAYLAWLFLSGLSANDLNTLIALVVVGIILAIVKRVLPFLRQQFSLFLGETQFNAVYGLALQAIQAAEQARRKGELDKLLKSLGIELPVNLSDEEKCLDYALHSVQQQVLKLPYGNLISTSFIYNAILSGLRLDAHKGPQSVKEQIGDLTPEDLLLNIQAETIIQAGEMIRQGIAPNGKRQTPAPTPQIPVTRAMPSQYLAPDDPRRPRNSRSSR